MPPRKKREPAPGEVVHLTVEDLAVREGVSIDTVYAWNRDGTGPTPMGRGSFVRYRLTEVVAWEESLLVRQPA
jgi:predicted DNA-binding transcriptional regulator AlpA